MAEAMNPQLYYDALTALYLKLFDHDWHLGYWVDAATLPEAAQRMNDIMLRRLVADAGSTVLDLGCGAGGGSAFIAEQRECSVVGVSNSRSGLAEAERYIGARGLAARVRFEFADALNLPFPDASFDAIWSAEAIHNITDMDRLAAELARVLKPRGSVVLGDLFALADPTEAGVATLKTFGLHLLTADQWIAALVRAGIQVSESISIGHHVGVQSLVVCTDICRTAATEAPLRVSRSPSGGNEADASIRLQDGSVAGGQLRHCGLAEGTLFANSLPHSKRLTARDHSPHFGGSRRRPTSSGRIMETPAGSGRS